MLYILVLLGNPGRSSECPDPASEDGGGKHRQAWPYWCSEGHQGPIWDHCLQEHAGIWGLVQVQGRQKDTDNHTWTCKLIMFIECFIFCFCSSMIWLSLQSATLILWGRPSRRPMNPGGRFSHSAVKLMQWRTLWGQTPFVYLYLSLNTFLPLNPMYVLLCFSEWISAEADAWNGGSVWQWDRQLPGQRR